MKKVNSNKMFELTMKKSCIGVLNPHIKVDYTEFV